MNNLLEFSSSKKRELISISAEVEKIVNKSNKTDGMCLVYTPHTTAAILINEDEPGFKADIEKILDLWIPKGDWKHNSVDGNATAHLASALIGQSTVVPITNGDLQLGTWQQIFLVELDGPRANRRIIVQIN